jgi:hypothetical protein
MKKNFISLGNSWAILFTKTMIELLDVNPETDSLEIVFEKNVATIKKSEQNK